MSDGVLDAYDDEASAWTDAHTTLDHNGDEDDDGDAWVDEDESASTPRASIPRPHDAIRSAKQAAKPLAQRLSSQPAPSLDARPLASGLSQEPKHSHSDPEPVEAAAVERWAGRAPPPHLARAANLGNKARWGPNVTRRVKTIDDVEATEMVEDENGTQPPAEAVTQDHQGQQQGGTAIVDVFDALADESGWDAPTGEPQGLQPALTPRKVNFQQEVNQQPAQSEDKEAQEEYHEAVDDTQEERPNDWGEPPYEVPEAPDNGAVLRLGDHWLEVEPPMGCRSWEIYWRRNPTLEQLDRPEDDDEGYWYADYYDDYAEYGQESSSHPVQHPDASPILFVGGLPYSLSVDELREAFTPYGNILRVAIPKDPETGESRGFGYVEFDSQDSAHSAMEALSGQELGGRTMRLDYALPRGHSSGDGGPTPYSQPQEYASEPQASHSRIYASEAQASWQPPPVNKSVTCTNTVALPFNRWGRKADDSSAKELNPESQQQPRDAMVNNLLQKQPRDSVNEDGWGPSEDAQAANDDGWGPTEQAEATTNDDGWGPNESSQAANDDGWGPTENVQASNDDGWGPSEETVTPTDMERRPPVTVESSQGSYTAAVPSQSVLGVDGDDEEDAVEIPATLKIDWPADTSGGWDDPVDSTPVPQAMTHLEPLQAVQRAQQIQPPHLAPVVKPVQPLPPAQSTNFSSPAEQSTVQVTTELVDRDEDKHHSAVEEHNKNAKQDDCKDDKQNDDGDGQKVDYTNDDKTETTVEDKNAATRPASLPQRPQWTPVDTKSSRSTGLNQGIRAPTVPPSGDQILLKNFKGRGGPPAASLPIPRVARVLATRTSEPSTPATPNEMAADPAAELQKLLEKTEAALQGFDAVKKTGSDLPTTSKVTDGGITPPAKKGSEPLEVHEKATATPVVAEVAPIEASLAAAAPADNRIEALVQQLKAQRERLKAILEA